MKRYLAIAVVGLALAGCAKDKISPAESVLLGCSSYASALTTLAPLRAQGKLSDGTVKIVDQVVDSVGPICNGAAPDVNATVADVAVNSGVKVLQSVIASVF
jgi:hypothetical protein